jgi:subtilisin family serine protease
VLADIYTSEDEVSPQPWQRDLGSETRPTKWRGPQPILRKRDLTIQENAPRELRVVSQAPGQSIDDLEDYFYEDVGGEGVTIYVLDSGLNQNHPVRPSSFRAGFLGLTLGQEFTDMPGSIRWIFTSRTVHTQVDPTGHGTCVASKATGWRLGTAKKSNLVVVKAVVDPQGRVFGLMRGLGLIYEDIRDRGLQGKAVINVSMGMPASHDAEGDPTTYGSGPDLILFNLTNRLRSE